MVPQALRDWSTDIMKKLLIIAGAGIAIFVAGVLFIEFSGQFESAPISAFGWFAFMIAAVLTIAISAGLFALIFFSARSGRDDITDF